jgi:predicted nuclease with TOPRIM domain
MRCEYHQLFSFSKKIGDVFNTWLDYRTFSGEKRSTLIRKALSTIKTAYDDCNSEVQETKEKIESLEKKSVTLREKLKKILGRADEIVDIESLNDIDDKILQLREDVANLSGGGYI